jgi:AbrB family looped-hinge helix DNA binding protein
METTTPTIPPLTQMSARGQITLPAAVRKNLALRPGEPFFVTIEDGRVVLEPAAVAPSEIYTDERIAEFLLVNAMDGDDLEAAKAEVRKMGIDPEPMLAWTRPK